MLDLTAARRWIIAPSSLNTNLLNADIDYYFNKRFSFGTALALGRILAGDKTTRYTIGAEYFLLQNVALKTSFSFQNNEVLDGDLDVSDFEQFGFSVKARF